MNSEKIIGYCLLIAGMVIILASTFSLYRVFTGQQKPPSVFSFEVPGISLPASPTTQSQLPAETAEIKILPDELINSLMNMSVYFLLMMFISSSGAKIASIGVKMIKDVKVIVKEEKLKRGIQNTPQTN